MGTFSNPGHTHPGILILESPPPPGPTYQSPPPPPPFPLPPHSPDQYYHHTSPPVTKCNNESNKKPGCSTPISPQHKLCDSVFITGGYSMAQWGGDGQVQAGVTANSPTSKHCPLVFIALKLVTAECPIGQRQHLTQ